MNPQDVKIAKEKILNLIKAQGPRLPVHVAKEINSNLIFTGAFLSEMLADKLIKLSHLRVGGTPLYMMHGQEAMLENFYTSLNNKEKEAYALLKQKGILEDEEQHPAIRVALRAIKDFAIPFKFNNSLYWRYLTFSEEQVREKLGEPKEAPKIIKEIPIIKQEVKPHKFEQELITSLHPAVKEVKSINSIQEPTLDIFSKDSKEVVKIKKPKIDFIEEIKSSLHSKGVEIIKIEKSDKKEAVIKARQHNKELIIFVLNKKKISDKELIKAYKKSLSYSLPYTIFIREEASKKLKENIEASKALLGIEKL